MIKFFRAFCLLMFLMSSFSCQTVKADEIQQFFVALGVHYAGQTCTNILYDHTGMFIKWTAGWPISFCQVMMARNITNRYHRKISKKHTSRSSHFLGFLIAKILPKFNPFKAKQQDGPTDWEFVKAFVDAKQRQINRQKYQKAPRTNQADNSDDDDEDNNKKEDTFFDKVRKKQEKSILDDLDYVNSKMNNNSQK